MTKKQTTYGICFDRGPAHGWADVGQGVATRIVQPDLGALENGVVFIADPANTGIIYIGRKGVTPDKHVDTGGAPLSAESSISYPIEDASVMYAVSDDPGQKVSWNAL